MKELFIGLIGVVLGSILTVLKDIFNDYWKKNAHAKYVATRSICILDVFMGGCILVADDDGYLDPDFDGSPSTSSQLPNIDFSNLNVNWESLPVYLMYEILSFQSYIDDTNRNIDFFGENIASNVNEIIQTRRYQYAILGLKAYNLSSKLRSKYKIPSKEYKNWNPVQHLNELAEKLA